MARLSNIDEDNVKPFYYSRNLPHMLEKDRPIFITYRLNFTIPKQVEDEISKRKEIWASNFSKLSQSEQTKALQSKEGLRFAWYDELLATCEGTPNILAREDIQAIIGNIFMYHDDKRYQLICYSIMPNHVHVLMFPKIQESGNIYPHSRIIYTWKRYSCNAINKLLNRSGNLWRFSDYDRMVRDEDELNNVINYIVMNPVKARLVDDWRMWKGNYVNPDFLDKARQG